MIADKDADEFVIWLNNGIDRGWITPPFCLNHDGLPLTVMEDARADANEDINDDCVSTVRILDANTDDGLAWFTRWGDDVQRGKL